MNKTMETCQEDNLDGIDNIPYMVAPEKNKSNIIAIFRYLKGLSDGAHLLSPLLDGRTKAKRLKLQQIHSQQNIRKKFWMAKTCSAVQRLPQKEGRFLFWRILNRLDGLLLGMF